VDRHDASGTAFTAADLAEADIVKALLLANGVPAIIKDDSAVAMLDGMVRGNLGIDVLVPADRLDEAREIIEEARRVGHLADEEDDEE
jgi:hypothetical protein